MIRGSQDKRTQQFFAGEMVREFSNFRKVAERKLTMRDNAADLFCLDGYGRPWRRDHRIISEGESTMVKNGIQPVRLVAFFNTTAEFWMNLQKTSELRLVE